VLRDEVRCFERECDRLLDRSAGKFVLIRGDAVAGVYETEAAAVAAGYSTFGPVPFLVRQILTVPERVELEIHEGRA
jgi:hypothetical protein